MTVSSTAVKEIYNANGATTSFAIPFANYLSEEDYIEVFTRDDSTTPATIEDQENPADYTIVGSNVVFGAAPASGLKVVVRRTLPLTQLLDYIDNGSFAADTHEEGLDRVVMLIQQLNEKIVRAVKMSKVSSYGTEEDVDEIVFPEPEANSVIGWNAAGTALTNLTLADGSTISTEYSITGSLASPTSVTAGGGITPHATAMIQTQYIQGSGGAVDISANPQIAAGSTVGMRLRLRGTSNTNTVLFEDGTGLDLNGSRTLAAGCTLEVEWDGSEWSEVSFSER